MPVLCVVLSISGRQNRYCFWAIGQNAQINLIACKKVVNGLATIVATQSLQLGTVSADSAIRCCFSITILVVIAIATIVDLLFCGFLPKWPILTFLRNMKSYFEILQI